MKGHSRMELHSITVSYLDEDGESQSADFDTATEAHEFIEAEKEEREIAQKDVEEEQLEDIKDFEVESIIAYVRDTRPTSAISIDPPDDHEVELTIEQLESAAEEEYTPPRRSRRSSLYRN